MDIIHNIMNLYQHFLPALNFYKPLLFQKKSFIIRLILRVGALSIRLTPQDLAILGHN